MRAFTDYIILSKEKLIIEYFSGKVSLKDVISLKEKLVKDVNYHSGYNIIDDIRDAQFELNKKEVKGYVDYILKGKKSIGNRNTAFLTNSPDQVVVSTFFESLKSNLPINTKIVSTISLALNHVAINSSSISLVIDIISKLKDNKTAAIQEQTNLIAAN